VGAQKIKALFQHARIPSWERRQWPVLTDGASIFWARRFGAAAPFRATQASRVILVIREFQRANSESGAKAAASNQVRPGVEVS
jgi:hypothetical protein